jgi:threonine aldolase
MYSFKNDYSETAHPKVLQRIIDTNMVQAEGYGLDEFSFEAIDAIKAKLKDNSVDVHFISGGTQTNLLATAAFLRAHEAVISAESGHIVGSETGAIEATGHKIYTVPTTDGKLTSDMVKSVFNTHSHTNFSPYPRLVFISNPTEVGTVYDKNELKTLHDCCKELGIYLYVDGARLGCAIALDSVDLSFEDMPKVCDAFYIGGTKNGAMFGEALVINNEDLKGHFRWHLKQRGGLLAKTRAMSTQFTELMSNNLYEDLASHANEMSNILREGIVKAGYSFGVDSPTNQTFAEIPNDVLKELEKKYIYTPWDVVDENTMLVRFITSWATPKEKVEEFVKDILAIKVNK